MDHLLGDILAKVKQLDKEKITIIIFKSDNGSPLQCPQKLQFSGNEISFHKGKIYKAHVG